MSYAPVRPLAPSRFGPGLKGPGCGCSGMGALRARQTVQRHQMRGLGTMLDMNMFTSAWYLPLVEVINKQTAARQYSWAPMKYLSNWDALDYNMGFTQYTSTTSQESTLYQWDGSQWRKTSVQSSV